MRRRVVRDERDVDPCRLYQARRRRQGVPSLLWLPCNRPHRRRAATGGRRLAAPTGSQQAVGRGLAGRPRCGGPALRQDGLAPSQPGTRAEGLRALAAELAGAARSCRGRPGRGTPAARGTRTGAAGPGVSRPGLRCRRAAAGGGSLGCAPPRRRSSPSARGTDFGCRDAAEMQVRSRTARVTAAGTRRHRPPVAQAVVLRLWRRWFTRTQAD